MHPGSCVASNARGAGCLLTEWGQCVNTIEILNLRFVPIDVLDVELSGVNHQMSLFQVLSNPVSLCLDRCVNLSL